MSNSDIQESPSDTKATANVLLSIAASDNNRTSNDNDDSVSLSPSNDNNSDDENKSDESDDENQSDENNNQSDDHSDSSNDEKQDKETPFIVQEEEHCVDDKPTDESPSVVDENENIDEEVEVTSFLPSSLKANEIPNKFIFYKNWDYPNVNGSEFNSDDQIKTISYLVFLRGLVYDRTMKKLNTVRNRTSLVIAYPSMISLQMTIVHKSKIWQTSSTLKKGSVSKTFGYIIILQLRTCHMIISRTF